MDALKRAEKARQAQAAKQADGPRSSTSKLSLDPLEDEDRAETTTSEPQDTCPPEPPQPPPEPPPEPPSEPTSGPKIELSPEAAKGPATTNFSLSDDFPPTEKVPPPAAPGGEKLVRMTPATANGAANSGGNSANISSSR